MHRLGLGVACCILSGCQPQSGTEVARIAPRSSAPAAAASISSSPPSGARPPPPSATQPPPPSASPVPQPPSPIWLRPKTPDPCQLELEVRSERREAGYIHVEGLHAVRVAGADGCVQTDLWRAHSVIGTGCAHSDPARQQQCIELITPIQDSMMQVDPTTPRLSTGREIIRDDFDFDGHRDLCVPNRSTARGYDYSCWVFDAKKRAFARVETLDGYCSFIRDFDEKRRQLGAYVWVGNSQFYEDQLAWHGRELLVLTRYERILVRDENTGEERLHDLRYRRRGNQLVKVSDEIVELD